MHCSTLGQKKTSFLLRVDFPVLLSKIRCLMRGGTKNSWVWEDRTWNRVGREKKKETEGLSQGAFGAYPMETEACVSVAFYKPSSNARSICGLYCFYFAEKADPECLRDLLKVTFLLKVEPRFSLRTCNIKTSKLLNLHTFPLCSMFGTNKDPFSK
jgi:hypothetical protein